MESYIIKYMFYVGLCIVKVIVNGDNMSIVVSLSSYLQFLYFVDIIFWIKDDNFSIWNICEVCYSSFFSIIRCCC